MKLTWFAATTVRIHIGGEILVADPDRAPDFVDRRELVSGADRVFALASEDGNLPVVDPAKWRPRKVAKLAEDSPPDQAVKIQRIGPRAVLFDAIGEPPLVLIASVEAPRFGRWADDAVVVLFGAREEMVATCTVLLDVARPKLIALAADEATIDLAIAELREHLEGAGLVSLEPGLALEV
ncbi:MAG TPA: hypothetical protein VL418_17455 [Devosiaceae bacterium]|nr:hypothetical protein [Devosiaceae bacterium]